jgi:alpha/beta hydrolase fold
MRRMRFLLTIGVASALVVAIYTGLHVRPRMAAMFHGHPVLALAFLNRNEARLHVDARRVFLAGDSAGAQIVGQLATVISSSLDAKRIGVVPSIDRGQLHGIAINDSYGWVLQPRRALAERLIAPNSH